MIELVRIRLAADELRLQLANLEFERFRVDSQQDVAFPYRAIAFDYFHHAPVTRGTISTT